MTALAPDPSSCKSRLPEQGDDEMDYDPDELVGSAEIARRLGVKARTVTVWTQRHDDFPAPFKQVGQAYVYLWSAVKAWYDVRQGRLSAGPRARTEQPPRPAPADNAEVAALRRELVRIAKRLDRITDDRRRMLELFVALRDAGVTWEAIGAMIGQPEHVPREAVRAMKKRSTDDH